MNITNRVTRHTLEGAESVSHAIRKRGLRDACETLPDIGTVRCRTWYRLPDSHDFYGMSRVPVLFCRILMEASLINELVVESTRKDRGESLSLLSLDSLRSTTIPSGF